MMKFLTELMAAIASFFMKLFAKKPPVEYTPEPEIKPKPLPKPEPAPGVEPEPEPVPIKELPKYAANLPQTYFRHILNFEGGYVNHPSDIGGETNLGITTGTLVRAKAANLAPSDLSVKDLNKHMDIVYSIYNKFYYKDGLCNKLQHPLAFAYFDACVNHGIGGRNSKGVAVGAGMLLQSVLVEKFGCKIDIDGRVGVMTLNAILSISDKTTPFDLAAMYNDRRELYYNRIIANNPSQKVFYKGWMNRLNSVRKLCLEGF